MKLKNFIILLTAFCFFSTAGTFDCIAAPSPQGIDLTNVKLMIPVDSKGTFKGTAIEIKEPSKYESPYFIKSSGFIDFIVPVEGATSSGSHYPRTEAQETKGGERYVFTAKEGGVIDGELAVMELPKLKKGKKSCGVFMQFHGKGNEPYRGQVCNDGYYSYKNDKSGPKEQELEHYPVDSNGNKLKLALGDVFRNRVEIKDGKLTTVATFKGVDYSFSEPLGKTFLNDVFFAKFGAYSQVSGKPDSGAGNIGTGKLWVRYYAATISHPSKLPTGNNCACP